MALNKKQINEYKEELLKKREDIEKSLKRLKENLDFGEGADEETEADESEEFSNYIGVKVSLEHQLDNIEKALEKIKEGKYGICEKCGKDISKEVLDANPSSILCKECKQSLPSGHSK